MSLISIDCSLRSWRDMFWRPSHKKIGLRSKHFSFVSEQTKTSDLAALEMEQVPIFRAVFDSRSSFFAPKPRESACYADYEKIGIKSKDREKVTGISRPGLR